MNNNLDRRIPKTKEEKEAHKALKNLEKQKRKEKSLQKSSNKIDENALVESVQKLTTTVNNNKQKPNNISNNRVRKASDMVSFSESSSSTRPIEDKSSKQNVSNQKILVRPQEVKQISRFKHLYYPDRRKNFAKIVDQIADSVIHPEIKKFGLAMDSHTIRGSTLRCQKFLESLKQMVSDLPVNGNEYFAQTFSNALDVCDDFLDKCRPLPVTIRTAINYLKLNLSMLNEPDHNKCRKEIVEMIDQFLTERIEIAHQTIKTLTSDYIKNNCSILVYSHSQLVAKSLVYAWMEKKSEISGEFQIVVVDTFPDHEGEKMISELKKHDIPFVRTNLASVPRVMPNIDVVILGAYAIMSNGNIISCSGSASIANVAKTFKKSVIVCAETYKFNAQNQSNSFEYNELNNPNVLVDEICHSSSGNIGADIVDRIKNWRDLKSNITVLDVLYDIVPGNLVSSICCEFGMISPTAVSYVSHVKQPY